MELWTSKQLAASLRIPVSTVRRLSREKKIPYYQIGRHYRYDPVKVEEHFFQKASDEDQTNSGTNIPARILEKE